MVVCLMHYLLVMLNRYRSRLQPVGWQGVSHLGVSDGGKRWEFRNWDFYFAPLGPVFFFSTPKAAPRGAVDSHISMHKMDPCKRCRSCSLIRRHDQLWRANSGALFQALRLVEAGRDLSAAGRHASQACGPVQGRLWHAQVL